MIEIQTQSSIPKENGRVSLATLATFLTVREVSHGPKSLSGELVFFS